MNGAWVYSIISFLYCVFHLAALILSVVFWRRCPKVCALVAVGAVLNLLASGARLASPMFLFGLFPDQWTFALFNLGIGFVNLGGSSLYLIAIFTGRPPRDPGSRHFPFDDEEDWDRPATQPRRSEPRGAWFRED